MMNYQKTILCLANSRKPGGRCVVGKEVLEDGYGEWIRPVSARSSEEISLIEMRFKDGQCPQVLDIISVPMAKPKPHMHQSENHLIDNGCHWVKVGAVGWADLESALDTVAGPLWFNGSSSYNGLNDEVPEATAKKLSSSLYLVWPNKLQISVGIEGVQGRRKRKVRASFSLGKFPYKFTVTDPVVEKAYLAYEDGIYPVDDAILCVSLGEVYKGYAYKLVAALITPDMGN